MKSDTPNYISAKACLSTFATFCVRISGLSLSLSFSLLHSLSHSYFHSLYLSFSQLKIFRSFFFSVCLFFSISVCISLYLSLPFVSISHKAKGEIKGNLYFNTSNYLSSYFNISITSVKGKVFHIKSFNSEFRTELFCFDYFIL